MRPYCEIYRQKSGKWSWRLKSTNHQVVATPRRAFTHDVLADGNAHVCKTAFRKAKLDGLLIQGYASRDDNPPRLSWRWKLFVGETHDGEKLHVYPHQSFTTRRSAVRSLHLAASLFKRARYKITR